MLISNCRLVPYVMCSCHQTQRKSSLWHIYVHIYAHFTMYSLVISIIRTRYLTIIIIKKKKKKKRYKVIISYSWLDYNHIKGYHHNI